MTSKKEIYRGLIQGVTGILSGEDDIVSGLSNFSAAVNAALPELNWCGFYLVTEKDPSVMSVGPFQGRPACSRIRLGKGVCGTAAVKRETQVVPDVDKFPGHIRCDSASRSEVVVPMVVEGTGKLIGVLDIDSPSLNRFDNDDKQGLEELVSILVGHLWGTKKIDAVPGSQLGHH